MRTCSQAMLNGRIEKSHIFLFANGSHKGFRVERLHASLYPYNLWHNTSVWWHTAVYSVNGK